MNTFDSKTLTKAVEEFEAEQKSLKTRPGAVDPCAGYRKARAVAMAILPFLNFIPVVGAGVAAAITAIVSVADTFCPPTK